MILCALKIEMNWNEIELDYCYIFNILIDKYLTYLTSSSDSNATDHRNFFITRSVSAGYVVIKNVSAPASGGDNVAPVRISDLRVVKTSGKNRTVVLSWRASGDDTDSDTGICN